MDKRRRIQLTIPLWDPGWLDSPANSPDTPRNVLNETWKVCRKAELSSLQSLAAPIFDRAERVTS
jgi:hypothetical protein